MNPNDPAFPEYQEIIGDREKPMGWRPICFGGLTKRELFAAMVMQGLISHHSFVNANQFYAEVAVRIADALIAELSKEVTK